MPSDIDLVSYLLKKLREEAQVVEDAMVNGRVSGWDDYRFQLGRVNGLRASIELIRNIQKNFEEYDD